MSEKYGRAYFANAKIGLFTHYTYPTYRGGEKGWAGTWRSASQKVIAESAEEVACAFDPIAFAEAAQDMCAQYVTFTVCHAGFNLLFPSKTMINTGCVHKTSQTDLVAGLLDELEKRDIPLVLYMPPNDNHDIDDADLAKMGWLDDDDGREIFINTLLEEIGERYNGRIAGFWFDQCGPRPSARESILKYNKNAVIWVNTGVTENESSPPLSDFLLSEYYGQITAGGTDDKPTHHSQINRIMGGEWWAMGGTATMDAAAMYRYTLRCAATRGQENCGVNWSCGPYIDQSWETGLRELMHSFGELVRKNRAALIDTLPGRSYVTESKSLLGKSDWGISTESRDGKTTFLHILNPPQNKTLILPKPADGKTFSRAKTLSGEPVALETAGNGYSLTIPSEWEPVSTVIILS